VVRRWWHYLLGFTRELVSLAALALLFVLVALLWRWGLFEFSYQALVQDGIPEESRSAVAQGMFTELAGWFISILAPFVAAAIVRGQIETQQTKRSGTFVGAKHLGFMHGLHNRVLSATEAVIQKNPQLTAQFQVAIPRFPSEPPSQTNAQMREAIDQHLLLTPANPRVQSAADECRQALGFLTAYESFLDRLDATDGANGRNKFIDVYKQYKRTSQSFDDLVRTVIGSARTVKEEAGYFEARSERDSLGKLQSALSANWALLREYGYSNWGDSPSIEDQPRLTAEARLPPLEHEKL
jgi:hypothetical protein